MAASTMHQTRRGGVIGRILFALLLLVIGFVGGSLATGYVIYTKAMESIQDPDAMPAFVVQRLDQRFGLTEDQKTQINEIVVRRRDRLHRMVYDAWPFVDAELNLIGDEIRLVMKEDQREEWDKVYADIREQWFKRPSKPPDYKPQGWW